MKKKFLVTLIVSFAVFVDLAAAQTTPEVAKFIAHPNYCKQLMGGNVYAGDAPSKEMAVSMSDALDSMGSMDLVSSLQFINRLCRARIAADGLSVPNLQ